MTLKDLLPSWYNDVYEMQLLMKLQQIGVDELQSALVKIHDNQYILTADDETISMHEKMLKIIKKPDDDLELRRFRVLNRLAVRSPYTIRQLDDLLSVFGPLYSIDMDYENYLLTIDSNFEKYGQISELENRVYQMIPANIELRFKNFIYTNPKNQIFIGQGIVSFESLTITHDFNQSVDLYNPIYVAQGSTDVERSLFSHDYLAMQEIDTTIRSSLGNTVVQAVEITTRGETHGI